MLGQPGLAGAAYLAARILDKLSGAWVGARLGGAGQAVRCWMGIALLPQAGVAIGMAPLAEQRFAAGYTPKIPRAK